MAIPELIVAGVVLALVAVAAVALYVADQRVERGLLSMDSSDSPEIAFRSVVHARSAFTKAVQDYEQALVRERQMAELGTTPPIEAGPEERLDSLEETKDKRRALLLDAQRLWDSLRPASGPTSELDLWIGTGMIRSWHLGIIGREMAVVRFDHATDETCWVVWGMRRLRFGLGVGFESQRIAAVATGCSIDQLEDVVSAALDGGEVAVRPGFAPLRAMRGLADSRSLRGALAALLEEAKDARTLVDGPSPASHTAVVTAVAADLDHDLETPGRLPVTRTELTIRTAGLSVMLGMWSGRRPACHVLARSNHRAWRVRSAADR